MLTLKDVIKSVVAYPDDISFMPLERDSSELVFRYHNKMFRVRLLERTWSSSGEIQLDCEVGELTKESFDSSGEIHESFMETDISRQLRHKLRYKYS